jgi:hypothetical protein
MPTPDAKTSTERVRDLEQVDLADLIKKMASPTPVLTTVRVTSAAGQQRRQPSG